MARCGERARSPVTRGAADEQVPVPVPGPCDADGGLHPRAVRRADAGVGRLDGQGRIRSGGPRRALRCPGRGQRQRLEPRPQRPERLHDRRGRITGWGACPDRRPPVPERRKGPLHRGDFRARADGTDRTLRTFGHTEEEEGGGSARCHGCIGRRPVRARWADGDAPALGWHRSGRPHSATRTTQPRVER